MTWFLNSIRKAIFQEFRSCRDEGTFLLFSSLRANCSTWNFRIPLPSLIVDHPLRPVESPPISEPTSPVHPHLPSLLPALSRDNPPPFRDTLPCCSMTMAKSLEVSPMKSLAEELEFVRKAYRESIQVYSRRVEAQLTALRDTVLKQTKIRTHRPLSFVISAT